MHRGIQGDIISLYRVELLISITFPKLNFRRRCQYPKLFERNPAVMLGNFRIFAQQEKETQWERTPSFLTHDFSLLIFIDCRVLVPAPLQ